MAAKHVPGPTDLAHLPGGARTRADGLELAPEESEGFFRVAQYGAVHTLEERTNELMLRVQV